MGAHHLHDRHGGGHACGWLAERPLAYMQPWDTPGTLPRSRLARCPFRKSGTSAMTRSMSCPRRRASSPHDARLLDARLRGHDVTHQGAAATGSVCMKWTSSVSFAASVVSRLLRLPCFQLVPLCHCAFLRKIVPQCQVL